MRLSIGKSGGLLYMISQRHSIRHSICNKQWLIPAIQHHQYLTLHDIEKQVDMPSSHHIFFCFVSNTNKFLHYGRICSVVSLCLVCCLVALYCFQISLLHWTQCFCSQFPESGCLSFKSVQFYVAEINSSFRPPPRTHIVK